MNLHSLQAIFRFTVLEPIRTRVWLFVIAVTGLVAALAAFSASLAITESFEYRVVSYASLMRLIAAFIVMLFVASSVIRELEDGTLDLIVSKPISRASWYIGKSLGYLFIVLLFSVLCVLPLLAFQAAQCFAWWFGLFAELAILALASLAFAITLKSATVAVTASMAFYVLSRVIGALVLMSNRAASEIAQPINVYVAEVVRIISYLLPDLSRFADVAKLIGDGIDLPAQTSFTDFHYVGIQLVIYCCVLSCVGMFDLYRRNL